jgi:GT2 family glycosyltransferase
MAVSSGLLEDLQEPAHERPSLSVIVAAYRPGRLLSNCLNSLRAQQTVAPFEVIVVASGDDDTALTIRDEYPGVRLLQSPRRMYCGEARNRGIELARGPILAFLDADCTVSPDWVESVLDAHRGAHQLVGGVIHNGSPHDALSWAYYFCEFNLWLPGNFKREIDEIAGCCLSMKREAFESHGPFLEGTYCSDTAFQWKLSRTRNRVLSSPRILVFHSASYQPRDFLRHIVEHRRCFARVCLREGRISKGFACLWLLSGPFLPLLLVAAISWRVVRAGGLLAPFLRSLHWVLAGLVARALGEMRGVWDCLFWKAPPPAGR